MNNDVSNRLIRLAQSAPLKGYVYSGNYPMIALKEKYNISDYYVVEILERLLESKEIKELKINYDKQDKHILSYHFK